MSSFTRRKRTLNCWSNIVIIHFESWLSSLFISFNEIRRIVYLFHEANLQSRVKQRSINVDKRAFRFVVAFLELTSHLFDRGSNLTEPVWRTCKSVQCRFHIIQAIKHLFISDLSVIQCRSRCFLYNDVGNHKWIQGTNQEFHHLPFTFGENKRLENRLGACQWINCTSEIHCSSSGKSDQEAKAWTRKEPEISDDYEFGH